MLPDLVAIRVVNKKFIHSKNWPEAEVKIYFDGFFISFFELNY